MGVNMQVYIGNTVPICATEFPKTVSFMIFFAGCNFRCAYCYNHEILDYKSKFLVDTKQIKTDIEKNKDVIEAVVFSGGEPCLQNSQLAELAKYTKSLNLKVCIETNGSKPDIIETMLKQNLIDYIAIDIKAPMEKEIFEKVTNSGTFFVNSEEVMKNIMKTLEILKEYENKVEIEVRTTIIPSLIYRKEDLVGIAELIKNLKCKWVLQGFKTDYGAAEKKLANLNAPSKNFLEILKDFIAKEYPNIKISIRT